MEKKRVNLNTLAMFGGVEILSTDENLAKHLVDLGFDTNFRFVIIDSYGQRIEMIVHDDDPMKPKVDKLTKYSENRKRKLDMQKGNLQIDECIDESVPKGWDPNMAIKVISLRRPAIVNRKSDKRKSEPKYATLEDIFITQESYGKVMNILLGEGLIDRISHHWLDNTRGYQSRLAALLFHLYHNGYYKIDILPNPETIKAIAYNTFHVSISERTIKSSEKINRLRRTLPFIKRYVT